METTRKDTFCANFVRPAGDVNGENQPCAQCGWQHGEHVTIEQLEAAHKAGKARLAVDRLKFRLYIYDGYKYVCYHRKYEMKAWEHGGAIRNDWGGVVDTGYRGTQFVWAIAERERVDPNYQPKPKKLPNPANVDVPELIKQLQPAIWAANNNGGRWSSIDWPLLTPSNIQALIDEISRHSTMARAA